MATVKRVLVALIIALLPTFALANDVLLTVTGLGEPRHLDLAALEAMGAAEFTTTTTWTDGEQTFRGVPLVAFLENLGVTEGTMKATAINDYAIDIPVTDAVENGPMIAFARNGELMSVRDKGPLWIVYPYDMNPDYRSEVYYSRSIWQLDRIEIIH